MYQSALPEQSKECVWKEDCYCSHVCAQQRDFTENVFPETKKRPCPYTWDKSVNFCDTTQIDICENVHSLKRTIIRAPMDNGWGPVRPY